MRARFALAVTLLAMTVVEPSAWATVATGPDHAAGSFAPVAPTERSVPEAAPPPASPTAGEVSFVIRDLGVAPIPTPPRRGQPDVRPKAVSKVVLSRPIRFTGRTSHVLRGPASWYCNRSPSRGPVSPCHDAYGDSAGFDAYAAAGPALRAAIGGDWRGRVVSVDGLRVRLVDWCQCYEGQANEKVIDLYLDVYRSVGGSVTIRW